MKKLVKVKNNEGRTIMRYFVEVKKETIREFNAIFKNCVKATQQHTWCALKGEFDRVHDKNFNEKTSEYLRAECRRSVKIGIVGGAVADALMGLDHKDVDVMLLTDKAEYKYKNTWVDYTGIHYSLTAKYGFLSLPFVYCGVSSDANTYKTQDNKIDFIFHSESGYRHNILDTVVKEFDQDIKLGYYNGREFVIHEDMHKALMSKKVGLNKHCIITPSDKECARYMKACDKYENSNTTFEPINMKTITPPKLNFVTKDQRQAYWDNKYKVALAEMKDCDCECPF